MTILEVFCDRDAYLPSKVFSLEVRSSVYIVLGKSIKRCVPVVPEVALILTSFSWGAQVIVLGPKGWPSSLKDSSCVSFCSFLFSYRNPLKVLEALHVFRLHANLLEFTPIKQGVVVVINKLFL